MNLSPEQRQHLKRQMEEHLWLHQNMGYSQPQMRRGWAWDWIKMVLCVIVIPAIVVIGGIMLTGDF